MHSIIRTTLRRALLSVLITSAASAAGASFVSAAETTQAAALPYQPHSVAVPEGADYIAPDGSIHIVGNDGMQDMLTRFNALFAKTHPGVRFSMHLEGSSTAIPAMTAGVSVFGPMGRDAWKTELLGFKESRGYMPTDVHIGYSGWGPRSSGKTPPSVYINSRNPLAGLTVDQVTRIFTSGHPDGDITHWKQVGAGGEQAKRLIHVYGVRDNGGFATALATRQMHGLPFTFRYEALENYKDVLSAVADDPYAIGVTGWVDARKFSKKIKLLPLAAAQGQPFVSPSYASVKAGAYPYSIPVRLYVDRAPGKPLDAFVQEYLRMVLSKEGQAIVASQKNTAEGYVPLSPVDLDAALKQLD